MKICKTPTPWFISLTCGLLFNASISMAADVLYVGDSHSYGCFGETVEKSLRQTDDPASKTKLSVRSVATCGSSVAGWLESSGNDTECGFRACGLDGSCVKKPKGHSESLLALLKKESPRVTVVALGTNMLKDKGGRVMTDVTRIIQQTKEAHSECIWIGPPQAAQFFISNSAYEKFNDELKLTVESKGCRYIASLDKTTRENLNDTMGLHYDCKNATAWGKRVAAEVAPLVTNLLTVSPRTSTTQPTAR